MGGGFLLATSWILERFPKYTALASNIKEWIFFGVAVVLGSGSYAFSQYVPAAVILAIAPYFVIIASVFSYVFVGKLFHQVDKVNR
jgi:hypothetical protein